MDQYFEIIVFLVTLVIFVFSAIKKQKKKPAKMQGGQPEQAAAEPSGAEKAIASLLGIPLEEMTAKKPNVEESLDFEEELEPDIVPIKYEKEGLTREGIDAIPDEESEQIEDEIYDDEPVFDARQAIIYSEIINRKY